MDALHSVWDWLFINQPVWISNLSNLTSFTILGAILGFYKRYNCDQPNCIRLGLHTVDGTTYRTCTKHMTVSDHAALQDRHASERPDQHELLNKSS